MARKDAILKMREILLVRRDALRKALAGDLSLLNELREQTAGDVVDFAWTRLNTRSTRSWPKSKAANWPASKNALERMRTGHYGVCEGCSERIPWLGSTRFPTPLRASNASAKPSVMARAAAATPIGPLDRSVGW